MPEFEKNDYNRDIKLQAFNNTMPILIEKDVNANITMFLFASIFKKAEDEQKEVMAKFVFDLKSDMFKFFKDRAKIDFDLSEEEVTSLDERIEDVLKQKFGPILIEAENYKHGKM